MFDEIEKAHPDVIQSMLQILDEGKLTDALGRVGDFRNSIIIITGNIGSELTHKNTGVGFANAVEDHSKVTEKMIEKASEALRPEFVNRLTEVIMYKPFILEDLIRIISLELKPIQAKIEKLGWKLNVTKSCKTFFANQVIDSKFGARPINRIIEKEIEDPLAELIMSNQLKENSKVTFSLIRNKVVYKMTEG